MASGAASCSPGAASVSPGASQPGATSSGASWMEFAVGSFNFGVDQQMLQGNPFERKHRGNFVRVVAKMVEEGNLDIVFGCEVGAPRQGCGRAMIHVKDILEEPFGDISVAEVDNYSAVYGFQPPPTVVLFGPPEKFAVPTGRDVDAAITRFVIVV